MTRLAIRSLLLALLLHVATNLATGFVRAPSANNAPFLTKTASAGKHLQRPLAVNPLQMEFKPLAFLNDKVFMKFAGPVATLGMTLPQLHDLSISNIQRVGETSFAAMLVIATIQGALVSQLTSAFRLVALPDIPPSLDPIAIHRSCINMPPIQPAN